MRTILMFSLAMVWACNGGSDGTDGTDGDDGTDGSDTAPADGTDTDAVDTDVTFPALPLCINEYMSSNQGAYVLEDGTDPDWIELHNPTDAAIDLTGWTISDDRAEPDKHTFTDGPTVLPGGYLLLFADSDPEEGPEHLSFNLSKDGEDLVLIRPDDGAREVFPYGPMASNFSFARQPDCCEGDDCWVAVSGGTPGLTNTP